MNKILSQAEVDALLGPKSKCTMCACGTVFEPDFDLPPAQNACPNCHRTIYDITAYFEEKKNDGGILEHLQEIKESLNELEDKIRSRYVGKNDSKRPGQDTEEGVCQGQ
jgi:hypothetical protein